MSLQLAGSLTRPGFRLTFDLDLPAGGFTAVCGPSGAGKSTLLRCVAGLEPDFGGVVRVGPQVWQDATRNLPTHRRALGYVFQDGRLFAHLDVAGNLRFGDRLAAPGGPAVGWDEVVRFLGLESLLDRTTGGLSGGERQRVALGRALLRRPDLLLLDEPLASLDTAARQAIFPLLERLRDRFAIPVLYVTHAVDEAARLADHLVLVDGGSITAQGPLSDLLTSPAPGLARGPDAGAVVRTTVGAKDPGDNLARLDFAGGALLVADPGLPVGAPVRVRIHARDVSLAVAEPVGTSILNILPVRVESLWPDGPGRVMVRLQAGDTVLLSAITARSAQTLDLAAGRPVWAQMKSVALL